MHQQFMHIAAKRRPLPVRGKFQQIVIELMLSDKTERPPMLERHKAISQDKIYPVVFSCN